jgi:hypothetical protein
VLVDAVEKRQQWVVVLLDMVVSVDLVEPARDVRGLAGTATPDQVKPSND